MDFAGRGHSDELGPEAVTSCTPETPPLSTDPDGEDNGDARRSARARERAALRPAPQEPEPLSTDPAGVCRATVRRMSDEKLTAADPVDLAETLAFALRYRDGKRVHDADAFMAEIVAQRLVRRLDRAGYLVMKRPPTGGGAAIGRGFAS